MTEPDVVEVTVHVAAQPETVFSYFTDPARYVQWMGGAATLDPAPGGTYRVSMRDGVQAAGEFVEVEPPHRLVFTWGWTHDLAVAPGSTRVVVTFHEEDGGTRVRMRRTASCRPWSAISIGGSPADGAWSTGSGPAIPGFGVPSLPRAGHCVEHRRIGSIEHAGALDQAISGQPYPAATRSAVGCVPPACNPVTTHAGARRSP